MLGQFDVQRDGYQSGGMSETRVTSSSDQSHSTLSGHESSSTQDTQVAATEIHQADARVVNKGEISERGQIGDADSIGTVQSRSPSDGEALGNTDKAQVQCRRGTRIHPDHDVPAGRAEEHGEDGLRRSAYQWCLSQTSVSSCLGFFMLFAVVSVTPRVLGMVASRLVPTVRLPAGLDQFRQLNAPCVIPGQMFTGHSEDGMMYKVTSAADRLLAITGISIAVGAFFGGILHSVPISLQSRKRCLCVVGVFSITHYLCFVIYNFLLLAGSPSQADIGRQQTLPLLAIGSLILMHVVCIMTVVGYNTFFLDNARSTSSALDDQKPGIFWSFVRSLIACRSTFRLILIFVTTAAFGSSMFTLTLHKLLTDTFTVISQLRVYGVTLLLSKTMLLVLRNVRTQQDTANQCLIMCTFFVKIVTAIATRQYVILISDDDENQLLLILAASVAMSVIELISRAVWCFSHLMLTGYELQQARLNTMTLDPILDRLAAVNHRMQYQYVHWGADQVAEICAIFHIFGLDLALPVWSQYRVWQSLEAFQARHWDVTAIAVIQLSLEILFCICFVEACKRWFHISPVTHVFRTLLQRPLWTFMLGTVMTMSVGFWPRCQLCKYPYTCMIYHECLRDGEVIIGGVNACKHHFNMTLIEDALWMREYNGMNATTMGCLRDDVDCDRLMD